MSTRSGPARRIGWGVTALAAISATVAIVAPQASAGVGALVAPDEPVVAGTTYRVDMWLESDSDAAFIGEKYVVTDNGKCIYSVTVSWGFGSTMLQSPARFRWTPTTAGSHTVTAKSYGTYGVRSDSFTVNVAEAPAGSTPEPATTTGCDGSGSFGGSSGSGSAGS
ncbi:hypothetical protein [Nocardia sp. NPDC057668]|uniref:hypothetical protein n=1 Tax=Nocardia sp. NPDC057668 TaxID=3346202 RepID=UPI003670107F